MTKIPAARCSPRNDNGVLHWYEGDTFLLDLSVRLRDESGDVVPFAASDTVIITFFDKHEDAVHQFSFNKIQDNTVQLDFDAVVTTKFPAGAYTYDAVYEGQYRRTIAKGNKAVVD